MFSENPNEIAKQESMREIAYLTYRVQHALYELQMGREDPIQSWEDFVLFMRGNGSLRAAARRVARYAVQNFDCTGFRFDEPETPAEQQTVEEGEDEIIRMSALFSEEYGASLLDQLLTRAEEAYYAHLSKSKGPGYSWAAYRNDLRQSLSMLKELSRVYVYALTTVDFKAGWFIEGIKILNK